MRISIQTFLWIIPFFSFLLGYQAISLFSSKSVIQTPSVLGKHIHDAIKELSAYQLNVRILKEKDDRDLPDGIVISQAPQPSNSIKPHQSVFLVITKKPAKQFAPNLHGLNLAKAKSLASEKLLRLKSHEIESAYPNERIIAQAPCAGEEIEPGEVITAYISSGTTPLRIFPSFKNRTVAEAQEFLKSFSIAYQVYHSQHLNDSESHNCSNCIIVDQRPLSGSLIDLRKQFTVQLTVQARS